MKITHAPHVPDGPEPKDVDSWEWYVWDKQKHAWTAFCHVWRAAGNPMWGSRAHCEELAKKSGTHAPTRQWNAWLVYWAPIRLTL